MGRDLAKAGGQGVSLPLDGVRVLDLTRLLPGAYATLMLAGMGADVVKIEDPASGDALRAAPPWTSNGESGPHAILNRGKRSVAIDLKQREGRTVLLRLVSAAEVLVDSFRPGVMERLGLGPSDIERANPSLVHVTIDAYGSGGPYQQLPAHDLNSAGYAGIIGLARDGHGHPAMPSVPVVDHLAGLNAVVAVLAGLRNRAGGTGGYRAEVAMADSAASILSLIGGYYAATGASPTAPEMLSGQLACYGLYECADGEWITVGGLEPKFFSRMLNLMGLDELLSMQYDVGAQADLRARLAGVFREMDRSYWLDLLAGEDTCVGPVNDVATALADPNLRVRGMVVDVSFRDGGCAPAVRAVPWLPGARGSHESGVAPDASTARLAPLLGEHTTEVLEEFGIPEAEMATFRTSGAIKGS